jgi:flagellar protein FlaJ
LAKKRDLKSKKQYDFEGMTLTPWQKISITFFGFFYRERARKDPDLKKLLVQADIRVMPEVYKSTQLMSTIAVMIGCGALLALVFLPGAGLIAIYESIQDPETVMMCVDWAFWHKADINPALPGSGCPHYATQVFPFLWKVLVVALVGVITPFSANKYFGNEANRKKLARADRLEKYLPYASSYTAAMAAANATPVKIFRSLAKNGEIYGDIAYDSSMIYRDMTLFGYDIITAVKLAVDRAASTWVTEFFQGMVGTLSSGGNLKLYFLNRAEHYMRENRIRLTVFLETLAMFAETYIVVAVAMPLFLIVMLVIMFWVSGAGSQISENMVYGIVMGLLPMIHIAYSLFVWLMSQENAM